MKSPTFVLYQLDAPYGKWVGRVIALNADDEKFHNVFERIRRDKTVKGTYTRVKEVYYG